jgi:ferritin-like metal-binding protein YciE
MADNQKDTLLTWLKDAYAMEQGIAEILERQIGQMDVMPEAQNRIRQHLELTKSQATRVKECVERLGDNVSHVKSGVANLLGAIQGMSTAAANDKEVKNAMGNYAIEHFEIASYMILAAAARQLDYPEIANVCETLIQEERDMARWLEQQIPIITRQHLMSTVNA